MLGTEKMQRIINVRYQYIEVDRIKALVELEAIKRLLFSKFHLHLQSPMKFNGKAHDKG